MPFDAANFVETDPFTFKSIIAWLETKPPNELYEYMDCNGACLYGQYLANHGISWDDQRDRCYWNDREQEFKFAIYEAVCFAGTFGTALKSIRKLAK